MSVEVIPLLIGRMHKLTRTPGKPNLVQNLSSSVTLIKGEENIIVDTGNVGDDKLILQGLAEQGLTTDDITLLVNTHFHFDHITNNFLFPHAHKIISHYEWLPDGSCLDWKINEKVIYERELIPGVKTILTQGHTFDHISVVAESDKTVVIAGDAIREKYLMGKPIPSHYHMRDAYIESMKRILRIADEIIPGHGDVIPLERIREYRKKWGVTP